jgi:hypothetical protein
LETTVFKQPAVVSTVQQNLVPVKLNADEFPQVAHAYGVKVLPTDVILAPDGRVLASFASPQDPADYLAQIAPFGMPGRSPGGAAVMTASHGQAQSPYAPTVPFAAGGGAVQSAYVNLQAPGQAAAPVQPVRRGVPKSESASRLWRPLRKWRRK